MFVGGFDVFMGNCGSDKIYNEKAIPGLGPSNIPMFQINAIIPRNRIQHIMAPFVLFNFFSILYTDTRLYRLGVFNVLKQVGLCCPLRVPSVFSSLS